MAVGPTPSLSSCRGAANLQRFMRAYNPRITHVNAADLVDGSVAKRLIENGFVERTFRSYDLK